MSSTRRPTMLERLAAELRKGQIAAPVDPVRRSQCGCAGDDLCPQHLQVLPRAEREAYERRRGARGARGTRRGRGGAP